MPPYRCWGYDDDGNVTRKGCCRGDNCTFVHPTNPRWATAKRSGTDRPPKPKRDSKPQRRTSGNSGGSSRSNDPWDKTSWNLTSSNATPVGPRAMAAAGSSASSAPNDWGSKPQDSCSREPRMEDQPGGVAGTSIDHGRSTAPGSEWGSEWGSGWGAAGQMSDNQDTGATQSGGWGTWGDTAQNWNPSNEQVGWDFNGDKGKGKEKEVSLGEDVQMKDLPTSRPRDAMPPPAFIPSAVKPTRQNESFTALPDPSKPTPSIKVQRPLPGGTRTLSEANILKEEASKLRSQSPLTKLDGANNYRGPKGRVTLYTTIIKHMQLVVSSQLELRRAKAQKEHFKNAVKPYTHPPVQAQAMFNALMAKYSARDRESGGRAERQLAALVDLPDFPVTENKMLPPPLVKETITAYTEELRDWFNDLQLDKRILKDKPKEPVDQTQDAPRSPAASDSTMSGAPSARELLERGNWSWREIQDAVTLLDTRLSDTEVQVNTVLYTNPDWNAMFESPHKVMTLLPDPETVTQGFNTAPPALPDVDSLATITDQVGSQLETEAERIAVLLTRVQALEEENSQIKAEQKKLDEIYTEAQGRFMQFEEWKQEDAAKIKDPTDEVQNLHQLQAQWRATSSQTSPTAMSLPPVMLEELLTDVRPIVLQHMQREIMPVLEKLRERCMESHEELKVRVGSILAAPVAMTNEICQRVLQMGITEAQTLTQT